MFKDIFLMGTGVYSYDRLMTVTCPACDCDQTAEVHVDDWGAMTWQCDCGETNEVSTEPDPDDEYERWRDRGLDW